MKNLFPVAAAAVVIIGISAGPAAAKHRKYHHAFQHQVHRGGSSYGMMPGSNAELMGNNGNSGQGPNSLGHIQGGNSGAGK